MTDRLANSRRHYQNHLERERKRRYDYFEKNKARWWIWRVKKLYNLTEQQHAELIKKQNGKCAICREKKDRPLCVDHNHQTNQIRGMLCHNCNNGLGMFKDDVAILKNAIKYLGRNKI